MSYKILINYDAPNWAYFFRAQALQKYAPNDMEISIRGSYKDIVTDTPNLILYLPFSYVDRLKKFCVLNKINPVILTSFNCGWGYQNNWLDGCIKNADATIINSFSMWNNAGKLPNTYYIPNGVDTEIFKPLTTIEKRSNRVLWCGSTFHRRIKGYDNILVPLQKKLRQKGVILDLKLTDSLGKNKLSSDQMTQWYNTGSIYVCTSLTEGTPNPALEAAACGCSIVSSKVGNMPELIENGKNGYLVDHNQVDSFYSYILLALQNRISLSKNMIETIDKWSWKKRSNDFYNLFRTLIDKKREQKIKTG